MFSWNLVNDLGCKHFAAACLLFFLSGVDAADEFGGSISYRQSGSNWYLESRQADLGAILDKISSMAGVAIHYSVLPALPVSASCIGASTESVLKCLLGNKVDMVFRKFEVDKGKRPQQATEVWLLGSSLANVDDGNCGSSGNQVSDTEYSVEQSGLESSEPSEKEKLAFRKEIAVSGDGQARAQAISYLATHALPDDNDVGQILGDALHDDNAEVRGQALTSLVAWKGEQAALPELQLTLQDSDPAMRLIALHHLNEATAIIELALHDDDALVRQFATSKLSSE